MVDADDSAADAGGKGVRETCDVTCAAYERIGIADVASDRLIASATLCNGRTRQVQRMAASRMERGYEKKQAVIRFDHKTSTGTHWRVTNMLLI